MTPRGVLMCEPAQFAVVDRKNPFMDPANAVDLQRAHEQWNALVAAFEQSGMPVHRVEPVAGCEDMVFTANPAFTGRDRAGRRVAVTGRMRYESRRREVEPQGRRLRDLGYEVIEAPQDLAFEGGGDAVWHPSGDAIFLGVGPRTGANAAPFLERVFGVDVIPLRLSTERFYHLDTALCALDEHTAIAYPAAFDSDDLAAIRSRFADCIEVDEDEALRMACNAARAGGKGVIIERSAHPTAAALRSRGYDVVEVDTSEFMKSGGSVYCMKQYLF